MIELDIDYPAQARAMAAASVERDLDPDKAAAFLIFAATYIEAQAEDLDTLASYVEGHLEKKNSRKAKRAFWKRLIAELELRIADMGASMMEDASLLEAQGEVINALNEENEEVKLTIARLRKTVVGLEDKHAQRYRESVSTIALLQAELKANADTMQRLKASGSSSSHTEATLKACLQTADAAIARQHTTIKSLLQEKADYVVLLAKANERNAQDTAIIVDREEAVQRRLTEEVEGLRALARSRGASITGLEEMNSNQYKTIKKLKKALKKAALKDFQPEGEV